MPVPAYLCLERVIYQFCFFGFSLHIRALVSSLSLILGIAWSQGFSNLVELSTTTMLIDQNLQELCLGKLFPECLGQNSWPDFKVNQVEIYRVIDKLSIRNDEIFSALRPHIILSRFARTVRWANHGSSELFTEGLGRMHFFALLSFWSASVLLPNRFLFVTRLAVAEAFVAQLVELVQPDRQLTQMRSCGSTQCQDVSSKNCTWAPETKCLPALMCSWQPQTFIRTWTIAAKNHSTCKSLLRTTFMSSQEFKVQCCWQTNVGLRFTFSKLLNCNIIVHCIHTYTVYSILSWNQLIRLCESMVCDPMMVVTMSGPMREPWGLNCIFEAFNACFTSNPGAMTRLLTCFMEHFSLSSLVQVAMLGLSKTVFLDLDWGALRVKQRFAAEVMRLEAAGSDHKSVRWALSELLREFPEIRILWPESIKLHQARARALSAAMIQIVVISWCPCKPPMCSSSYTAEVTRHVHLAAAIKSAFPVYIIHNGLILA